MFISFFSGKVMLFYGITLIMKEKSNASARIGTAAPTHYFRVFKIEYWQQRPRIEDMRWPA